MASRDEDLWTPDLADVRKGPLYLAIAQAIAADIASGKLKTGDRLPAQRVLAARLGVDFTTIGRAYNEARKNGHLAAGAGRGTFVRARESHLTPSLRENDLSMNMPPRFEDSALIRRMWAAVEGLGATGLDLLMRYQKPEGDWQDREAATLWLSDLFGALDPACIVMAPGAQGATYGALKLLTRAGDTAACEAMTYPGFMASAARLGLKTAPIAMDEEGMIPESAAEVFASERPKILYCTPTLHNPTTATLSLPRRAEIAALARKFGVKILEDDAYGRLPQTPIPPLSSFAPEISYYIASLSKALAPALRLAYVVTPSAFEAERLVAALRGTANLAAPLSTNIATEWIVSGIAEEVVHAIREETRARHTLAQRILGPLGAVASPSAYHLWLPLKHRHMQHEMITRLRSAGVGAMPGDSFAAGEAPLGLRISLGSAPDRLALEASLRLAALYLGDDPALSSLSV